MANLTSTAVHRALSTLSISLASCLIAACSGAAAPTVGSQAAVATAAAPTVAVPSPSSAKSAVPSPTVAPFEAVRSVEFRPTLTFPIVPSTWSIHEDTLGTFILFTGSPLTAADGSPSAVYVLAHGMIAPASCANPVDKHQNAKQMTAVLVGLPGLVTSKPKAVTLSGHTGFLVEIHVAPTWKETCVGTIPSVPLLHGLPPTEDPSFDDGIGVGTMTAMYLLDRPEGGVMTIQIDDQSGGQDLATYRAVVERMRLAP